METFCEPNGVEHIVWQDNQRKLTTRCKKTFYSPYAVLERETIIRQCSACYLLLKRLQILEKAESNN